MAVYDRLETENPLLDEILYNAKLMIKSCVLKNQHEADNAEIEASALDGEVYLLSYEGRCSYSMFDDYEAIDYRNAGILDQQLINDYLEFPDHANNELKDRVVKIRMKRFVDEYEEYNSYYRNICGLPPLGDPGIFLTPSDVGNKAKSLSIDFSIPLHEMDEFTLKSLKSLGVIDKMIEKYPKKYYLKNLTKGISIYKARRANNYSLLYVQEDGLEEVLVTRFKELIEENRPYFIHTATDDAYRMYNDYYDRFIIMMIVAQTVCDMINEIPDYYIRRDVFDIRTCEYFMEANGVEFFPEIPLKYQIKMVKDINLLCKYKSTNKNIKHITKIFGYSNIKIFQYYLQKVHKKDGNGNYIMDGILEDKYDLQFVKVPLDGGEVDDYSKSSKNIINYNSVVSGDKYWTGPYSQEYVKHGILEKDFNIIKSKYLTIDATLSLTELTFQSAYFINMILYSPLNLDKVTVNIPSIGTCKLADAIVYLYALSYLYYERSDDILYDMSSVLTCRGFNFDADLTELSEYVANKGFTLEELGVSGFEIPKSGVLSLAQMMQIFIDNRKIYDYVQDAMYNAQSKDEFDCYQKIYDALFITEINYKNFYIEELGREANTYSEYLQYKNPVLYSSFQESEKMYVHGTSNEDMKKDIINKLDATTNTLVKYDKEIQYAFSDLPSETLDVAMSYMNKIINFFKSFKVTVLGLQNIYYLDHDNIYIIDDMDILYILLKRDYYHIYDSISYIATLNKVDKVDILEHTLTIPYFVNWIEPFTKDWYKINDNMAYTVELSKKDFAIQIQDILRIIAHNPTIWKNTEILDKYHIYDQIKYIITLDKKDIYTIIDEIKIFSNAVQKIKRVYEDTYQNDIIDDMSFTVVLNKKDIYDIKNDIKVILTYLKKYDKLNFEDFSVSIEDMTIISMFLEKKDKYIITDEMAIKIHNIRDKIERLINEDMYRISDNFKLEISLYKKDICDIKDAFNILYYELENIKKQYEERYSDIGDDLSIRSVLHKKDAVNIADSVFITTYKNGNI